MRTSCAQVRPKLCPRSARTRAPRAQTWNTRVQGRDVNTRGFARCSIHAHRTRPESFEDTARPIVVGVFTAANARFSARCAKSIAKQLPCHGDSGPGT